MRILNCIHSLNPAIGGPLESVRQSSLVLARRGHTVETVALDAPDAAWAAEFPGVVHLLGPGRGSYGYSPRYVPWLKEQAANFDAVVVHGLWQYTSFGVWRALRKTVTPWFVYPHGMLDPWFNRAYRLKHLKKMLYWPWAEFRVLRDAAAVLFTADEERLLARESFRPYRVHEIVVNFGTAAPSVDWPAARADFVRAFPLLREKNFLLFLGRLHEKKGCAELIRAFAETRKSSPAHPGRQLVLAGPCADENYLRRLHRLTNELFPDGTPPVIFTGMLTGNLKWGAFALTDAFILPSHQENFGLAVVEALACGIPVLISNQVNIWREIVAGGCGYAEDDDLAGVRRLLERWEATPPNDRARMSAAARRTFTEHFEINRAVDSFLRVLENGPRAA